MTKETRIGLLVGLLFIIMFGLVLSELTGSGSGPPAPAAAEENFDAYAHTPVIQDLSPPIGYAGAQRQAEAVAAGPGRRTAPAGAIIEAGVRPGTSGPAGGVLEAHVYPDAVLAATDPTPPAATEGPAPNPAPTPDPAAEPAPRRRVYTVEANDTLIRIARKVYGRESELEYKRIYQANRRVLPNESTLTIGQELVIPPLPAPAAPAARTDGPALRHEELTPAGLAGRLDTAAAGPGAPGRRTYVVQRGDSLTSIARRFLHDESPAAVRKIFLANRGRMDGPDQLDVGVALEIPN